MCKVRVANLFWTPFTCPKNIWRLFLRNNLEGLKITSKKPFKMASLGLFYSVFSEGLKEEPQERNSFLRLEIRGPETTPPPPKKKERHVYTKFFEKIPWNFLCISVIRVRNPAEVVQKNLLRWIVLFWVDSFRVDCSFSEKKPLRILRLEDPPLEVWVCAPLSRA